MHDHLHHVHTIALVMFQEGQSTHATSDPKKQRKVAKDITSLHTHVFGSKQKPYSLRLLLKETCHVAARLR